jgi:hypothetical protein
MGQQNDSGRNASLDEKKVRAAGRQMEHPRNAPQSEDDVRDIGGAFGKDKLVDESTNFSKGAGGGGAAQTSANPKERSGAFEGNPDRSAE